MKAQRIRLIPREHTDTENLVLLTDVTEVAKTTFYGEQWHHILKIIFLV